MPTNASRPTRILTVDDHPVFRAGLSILIAFQPDMVVVAQAATGLEALAEFRRHQPDITLLDLGLPDVNGLDTLRTIRTEAARAHVIVLTTSDGYGEIRQALRAGADAYALKSMPTEDLLAVIRAVQNGRHPVVPEVAVRLAEFFGHEDLTMREVEVLGLIRDGYLNKQIADRLAIAETTVVFHVRNITDKLDANSRTHAVTIAMKRGLLTI